VARRVERQEFSPQGCSLVDATLDQISAALGSIAPGGTAPDPLDVVRRRDFLVAMREKCLGQGAELPWEQRGAVLELLGSAERAFFLIDRIDAERRSVPRIVTAMEAETRDVPGDGLAPATS
jgi:phosphate:Na+ symporter